MVDHINAQAKLQRIVLSWDYWSLAARADEGHGVFDTLKPVPNTFADVKASRLLSLCRQARWAAPACSTTVQALRGADYTDEQEYKAAFEPLLLEECSASVLRGSEEGEVINPHPCVASKTETVRKATRSSIRSVPAWWQRRSWAAPPRARPWRARAAPYACAEGRLHLRPAGAAARRERVLHGQRPRAALQGQSHGARAALGGGRRPPVRRTWRVPSHYAASRRECSAAAGPRARPPWCAGRGRRRRAVALEPGARLGRVRGARGRAVGTHQVQAHRRVTGRQRTGPHQVRHRCRRGRRRLAPLPPPAALCPGSPVCWAWVY